jgi:hypothetical protein
MKSITEVQEIRNIIKDYLKIKGVPSLTTTQRNALSATNGIIIYNTTTNKFQGYENGSWENLV